MEENPPPPRTSRKDGTQEAPSRASGGATWRSGRHGTVDEGGSGGDLIECSGKYCRSCTAGMIADCVALCCCPCALVNLLTLAFVKVPWKMGRRCLGLGKNKRKTKNNKKLEMMKGRSLSSSSATSSSSCRGLEGRDGNNLKMVGVEEGILEILSGFGGEDEEMGSLSARFAVAEKVWVELYEVGHLGFGRVSFTD